MQISWLRLIPLLAALALASCFEEATVVKVKKDGSGIVHVRSYSATKDKEEDVELPKEADLQVKAEAMGEGVRLRSVEKARSSKGWFGHEVVYEFDDINNLTLLASDTESGDQPEIHFTMKDDVLDVRLDMESWRQAAQATPAADDGPTIDPYAGSSGPPAAGTRLQITPAGLDMKSEAWKKMSRGMRFGFFLQIDDPLAEAGAPRRDDGLFTLFDMDFEKITRSGELEDMQELNAKSRAAMQDLVDKVDGFEMELQEPARFVFE